MADSGAPFRTPPLPGPLGRLMARVYHAEVSRRNRRYDRGEAVERLPVPVISVGNLSVGGTGKTPMVRQVCGWAVDAGVRPCVAMRGYKAGGGESDEAREYAETLPGVPVVARPDRAVGVRALLNDREGATIGAVVLDDGFQHRRLARDLDIVLLDATRDPFADRVLPAGWLREEPDALRRAHAVVVTHTEQTDAAGVERMLGCAKEVNPALLVAAASHAWHGFTVVDPDGAERSEPNGWLAGRTVMAVCAIGNPGAFLAQARAVLGGAPMQTIALRDHAPYSPKQVARIASAARSSGASVVLTTRKDLVKLRGHAETVGVPIAAANLGMVFERGGEDLRMAVLGAATPDRVR